MLLISLLYDKRPPNCLADFLTADLQSKTKRLK